MARSSLSDLFSQIQSSVVGVILGLLIGLAAILTLWFNEGRAVKTARGLKEGAAAVITVPNDHLNPENEGKLIHTSGIATVSEPISDSAFGITETALQLHRTVEMYQWQQKTQSRSSTTAGTSTTDYTYEMVWSADPIDSSGFAESSSHSNPKELPYKNESWIAADTRIGALFVPSPLIAKLRGASSLTPTEDSLKYSGHLPPSFRFETLYLSKTPDSPSVGDLRINWKILRPGDVSVIGKQFKHQLQPYVTKAGTTIELASMGNLSAAMMIENAVQENIATTWGIRMVGYFLMFGGIMLAMRPFAILGKTFPPVQKLLNAGMTLFAFVTAAMISLVVIALGWIAYRPLAGILLLAVVVIIGMLAERFFSKKGAPKMIG